MSQRSGYKSGSGNKHYSSGKKHYSSAGKAHSSAGKAHSSSKKHYSSTGKSHSSSKKHYSSAGKSHSSAAKSHSSASKSHSSTGRSRSSSITLSQRKRRRNRRRILRSLAPYIFFAAVIAAGIVLVVTLWPAVSGRPNMKLIGKSNVVAAQGEPYVDEGVTARVLRKDVSDKVYVTDNVDTSQLGTYEYEYHVDGRRKTYTVVRNVEVTDQTGPLITLNGDSPMYVNSIGDYTDPGATAVDNCDGDVSAEISESIEQENDYTWLVTYTAYDQSGNEGTAVREVQLNDNSAPVITLNGDSTITISQFTDFTDPGVTAIDDRDGDISASVTVDGSVDKYRSDTYTITYRVSDAFGNESEAVRYVVVESAPSPDDHAIYLTFDDGPSSIPTVMILDVLQEYDIKATFFICNYDEDKIPILQRMIDEGHTIGIHGYSHDYAEIYTSVDAFMNNIYKLRDKLYDDFGYEAFVTRFPGGTANTMSAHYCVGIMSEIVDATNNAGLMYMDWNTSSGDSASEGISAEEIVANVESELEEDRENVVLMHDYAGRQTSAEALPYIIDYGLENGYSFYPVTKETTPVHQPVMN